MLQGDLACPILFRFKQGYLWCEYQRFLLRQELSAQKNLTSRKGDIMSVFSFVKRNLRCLTFKKQWRKANAHNGTWVKAPFDISLVCVGKKTYGCIDPHLSNAVHRLVIGSYCSIADEVRFLVSADHHIHNISTFPFRVHCLQETMEGISKGDIIVDDDVWIGYRATILSGVRIGQGAVVAAGAVVTKDVPPYAIVGGVPAKVLSYRFSEDIREALLQVDFSLLDDNTVRQYADALYTPLENVSQLDWLPKKKG